VAGADPTPRRRQHPRGVHSPVSLLRGPRSFLAVLSWQLTSPLFVVCSKQTRTRLASLSSVFGVEDGVGPDGPLIGIVGVVDQVCPCGASIVMDPTAAGRSSLDLEGPI